jgi:hypothetical protein
MMETIYTVKRKVIEMDSPADYMNIWFWGDVHRDATSCDVDRWKYFLKKSAEDDPEKTWYMCMGDTHDFASDREQQKLMRDGYSLHETTRETIDDLVIKRNRAFCSEIKQMNGRLLGMIDGNHNWRFPNGVTASEDLANRMGCEHLGWLCHYTLTFKFGGKQQNVYILACHGRAGGKRAGASINQLEDMKTMFPIADIYVMGHDHNRGAWPTSVLYPTNAGMIKQKRQFFCRSGSFKLAYEDGKSSYETGRLLRPSDLGALKLKIGFHRDQKGEGDRIITDIEAII